MAQTKTPVKAQEKAVVKWKGEQITVSFHDVKTLICPYATAQETAVFLKTCQSLQLNPFANEIYLIKYSEGDKAAMVIAIDSYLKAGEGNPNYDGHEAGVVLKDSTGKLEFREGSLLLDEEKDKLVGGFAKVYRKDRTRPFYMAVNKAECIRHTKDGHLTRFWAIEKQPSMLRKTALKRALVEAFPQLFSGAYSTAEFEEVTEGELPPAYQKPNGEADWRKFWVRQKEKGLDEDKVHNILGIASLKDDWLEQGRTLEEAEEVINKALAQSAPETKKLGAATPSKPKQADWRAFWEHTEQLGLSQKQVHEMLGVNSVAEWTDQGKTLDEAIEVVSKRLTSEAEATNEIAGRESLDIDLDWLKESQKTLKWTEDTMLTFIISQYKVSDTTSVIEALNKLTREQAQNFVSEINTRLEKQTSLF